MKTLNNAALKIETNSNTNNIEENNMKTTMTEEKLVIVKKLCKEFRESCKDETQKPYKDRNYGNKLRGNFDLLTYTFYAFIRGKNIEECVHSIKSEKYNQLIEYIKDGFKRSYYNHKGLLFKVSNLNDVMPSLKEHPELLEEFKSFVIKTYIWFN